MTSDRTGAAEPTLWQIVAGSVAGPRKIAVLFPNIKAATRRAWQLLWLAAAVQVFTQTAIELCRLWGILPTVPLITHSSNLFLKTPTMRITVGTGLLALVCGVGFPVARTIWFYFCKEDSVRFGIIVGFALSYGFVALAGFPEVVASSDLFGERGIIQHFISLLFLGSVFFLTPYYMTLRSGLSYRKALLLNCAASIGSLVVIAVLVVIYLVVFPPILRQVLHV